MPDPNANELKDRDLTEERDERYDPYKEHTLAEELAEFSKAFPLIGELLAKGSKYFDR